VNESFTYPLLLATRHDHDLRALVVTGTVALGQITPRIDCMTAFTGLAFTTTVRVVNRVHHHTTDGWADTHPTLHTGLAQLAQAVFFVGHLTDGRAAVDVNLADFAGTYTHLGVCTFTRQQRGRSTGRADDLNPCPLATIRNG